MALISVCTHQLKVVQMHAVICGATLGGMPADGRRLRWCLHCSAGRFRLHQARGPHLPRTSSTRPRIMASNLRCTLCVARLWFQACATLPHDGCQQGHF